MKRVLLEQAYILHRRAYRETSFIVELFTLNHGRLSVIAKGVRKAKSQTQGLLQPFIPLLTSFSGGGELMTLTQVEPLGEVNVKLERDCLIAGFYLNELLVGLVERFDPHSTLFMLYDATIKSLHGQVLDEKCLRRFEKRLLEELGYGLFAKSDRSLRADIQADKYYRLLPLQGFVLSELGEDANTKTNLFFGKQLLSIANEDWSEEETLQDAKRLMRIMLTSLLGKKQIYSRQLFLHREVVHD